MKRIFTAAAAVLLAMSISTSAFAHSHIGGSNPADGEVVTEPLKEIVLEFDGKIEQGSYIDVKTTEGKAIKLQDIIIGDGTLTGTVVEPLPNDEYQVNWSIISADGHPLEGEFSFTVNAPVPESVEEVTKEPSETTKSVEKSTEDHEKAASADKEEKESSSMSAILIVLLVIIVAGGFFLLTKRKK
ncbi:copper resistance CopC family protein [Cytobacillus dafuensis]|uniref:Copper resistance protein CopC n=1 Tax=Cytobacillus dafuensis TaxID=1742359 RepID=A0A5B8Z8G6_CYTDA|nr:copper resistance protein CopC [Cytobacillus dafuensis]QED48009.1 copper resistance protein CopC [Cytobacillus dafuensis]